MQVPHKPVYLLLLPVFFILHGFAEYVALSPLKDALELASIYITSALVLCIIFWLWWKNLQKAAFISFLFLAINFFFGSVHDFLKHIFPGSWLVKYSVLLPLLILLLCLLVVWIKNARHSFTRTGMYLNILFSILVIIDLTKIVSFRLSPHGYVKEMEAQLTPCDTCSKPDIYLLLSDEYAGNQELKDVFSYDNAAFENNLRQRGFHINEQTVSNYNYTVYSMASMFNMNFIRELREDTVNEADVTVCRGLVKNNVAVHFLEKNGYDVHNFSFLDFSGQRRAVSSLYFPTRRLFTARTLLGRLYHDLWFHFASDKEIHDLRHNNMYNNQKIDSLTRVVAAQEKKRPVFVYSHLIIPHHPYFFDSSGRETADSVLMDSYKMNRMAYIGYLQYANRKLLDLIDDIRKKTRRPTVIMLLSDHGFHEFMEPVDTKYHFININAVYLPDGAYGKFYNGISNVNQLRVLFNQVLGQHLPMLPDSSSFLWESKLPVIMD